MIGLDFGGLKACRSAPAWAPGEPLCNFYYYGECCAHAGSRVNGGLQSLPTFKASLNSGLTFMLFKVWVPAPALAPREAIGFPPPMSAPQISQASTRQSSCDRRKIPPLRERPTSGLALRLVKVRRPALAWAPQAGLHVGVPAEKTPRAEIF